MGRFRFRFQVATLCMPIIALAMAMRPPPPTWTPAGRLILLFAAAVAGAFLAGTCAAKIWKDPDE